MNQSSSTRESLQAIVRRLGSLPGENVDTAKVDHPNLELAGVVLWPSFLAAALTVGIVFTLIDPQNVNLFGVREPLPRPWAYTLGFFLFWALYAATSLTSVWLHRKNHSPD